MAALRTGAGLVSFALPHSLNAAMEAKLTEVMTIPLPESEPGVLGVEAAKRLMEWLEGKSALVLGPGMGTHPETVRCVHEVLRQVRIPTVLDADGLNALATDPDSLGDIQAPLVLTPHPGELGTPASHHNGHDPGRSISGGTGDRPRLQGCRRVEGGAYSYRRT